jgi:hypothetical protein
VNLREADYAVTAQEIAKQYETTVGNVYKLACLHRWRRIRKSGRVHYDVLEVARTLGE